MKKHLKNYLKNCTGFWLLPAVLALALLLNAKEIVSLEVSLTVGTFAVAAGLVIFMVVRRKGLSSENGG